MTATEYIARGVRFVRTTDGVLTAQGPIDERVLLEELLTDIAARVDGVRERPTPKPRGVAECDACNDELAPGRGGWCDLCVLARQNILMGEVPPTDRSVSQ